VVSLSKVAGSRRAERFNDDYFSNFGVFCSASYRRGSTGSGRGTFAGVVAAGVAVRTPGALSISLIICDWGAAPDVADAPWPPGPVAPQAERLSSANRAVAPVIVFESRSMVFPLMQTKIGSHCRVNQLFDA
jgi:hypothetical protein